MFYNNSNFVGPANGEATMNGVGFSAEAQASAAGTVGGKASVQLTGVLLLILVAVVWFLAMKWPIP